MIDKIQLGLVFAAAMIGYSVTYLAAVVLGARALRLGIVRYGLGIGPVVLQTRRFKLRLIPIHAFIDPARRNAIIPPPSRLQAALDAGEVRYYDDLPLGISIVYANVMILSAFGAAALCLGLGPAARAATTVCSDYIAGFFGPLSTAPQLLTNALTLYRHSDARTTVGRTIAIFVGMDLVALPNNLMFLLPLSSTTNAVPKVRAVLWLALTVIQIVWLIAFVTWIVRT